MKTALLLTFLAVISLSSCRKNNSNNNNGSNSDKPCGDHHSQQLYKDSDGNCYLINGNGEKEYVEKHECNC